MEKECELMKDIQANHFTMKKNNMFALIKNN